MKSILCILAICVLCIGSVSAAAYIKFDGVDGESTDADHDGWIDVLSISQSIHKPGGGMTGSSRRRGSAVFEDIVITKELDKSSPKLAEALAKGDVFPTVEIEVTKKFPDQENASVYLVYELKNAVITSYELKADIGLPGEPATTESSDIPIPGSPETENIIVEEVRFNFEEIEMAYTEYDNKGFAKGIIDYIWSLVTGRGRRRPGP